MALSLAACGGSSETETTPVDLTTDNAGAILDAVVAVDSGALTVQEVADRAKEAGSKLEAQGTIDAINELLGSSFTIESEVDTVLAAIADSDNASEISAAFRDAAADLGITGTSAMTNAELITAIKTANDEAVKISDNTEVMMSNAELLAEEADALTAGLKTAAADLGVTGTSTMTNAELIAAIKTVNDEAVKISDNTAVMISDAELLAEKADALTAGLKAAADDLGVTGTSTMTNAELITAIKTVNDEAVKISDNTEVMISNAELAIRVAADNDTATNTAVSDATAFSTLAELIEAYNILVNPVSFTLTTGVNIFSTATTEDVSFDASTVNSLSNGDELSGGSGTDTLTANLSNISVSVNSTGIEVFTLNVAAAGAATLDLTDVTGLKTVNNVSSLNDLTLNNLAMLPTLDLNTISDVTTLNFSNAAMSGGADDLAITLNGATGGATINLTSVAGSANTIETVSVESASVPNTIDLNTNAVGATTVEVTGSQNLDLGTVESLVSTVSAGDFTGNLTMTAGTGGTAITSGAGADVLTGNAGNDNLITGDGIDLVNMTSAGDDQVNLGAGSDNLNDAENVGAADTVVGGAGSDTLTFSNASDVAAANLALTSGFDVIALEDDTIDSAIAVGLDDTVVGASDADTIIINGVVGDTVTVTAAVGEANVVLLGDGGAAYTLAGDTRVTIAVDDADSDGDLADEASTTVTLGAGNEIVTGSDGQDTIQTTVDAGSTETVSLGAGTDTVNDANNIVATATFDGGAGTDTLQYDSSVDVAASGLALTTGFDRIFLADNAADDGTAVELTDAVVGGSDADTITVESDGDANDVITVTAAVSAANTVILADGANSFTLAGDSRVTIGVDDADADGDLADEASATVTLGAGNEIVTGSDGQDTIQTTVDAGSTETVSLGAGTDTVNDANNIVATATFDGGAGTDTLQYDSSVDVAASGLALTTGFDRIFLADNAADDGTAVELTDAVVGGSDADTITVESDGDSADVITVTAAVSAANTVILADGANSFTLAGDSRVTIGVDDADADGDLADEASATVTLGAGNEIVTGSDGQDTVVLGTGAATSVNLGAGVDTFSVTDANLTGFNVLNGGDGDDVLSIIDDTDADTIVDNDFTGKTSIEALTLNNDDANSITLGSKAAATGIATVTLGSGDDDLTVDSGYTGSITVDGSANGANTISLANSSAAASVTGGSGIDTITAGSGDMTIVDAGADADVIVAGSGTMTITDAGAGADVVTGSTGALIITDAGAGADEITVSTGQFNITAGADVDVLIISNGDLTSADTFAGGNGDDVIRIDNATTLVDADFTNVTSTKTLNSAAADVALDVTLGTEANEAGLVDIDGGTAGDVINGAGMTLDLDIDDEGGDNTITGGAGDDNIATGAGADSITGGAGADTLNGGGGADTYVFSSTAVANGDDTISFVQADDRLDFSSFLSGGSVEGNTTPVAATGTDDIQLNNKLIIIDDASANLAVADVVAAIQGIGDAMELSSGGKGIVLVADAADANSVMSIFYVDDSLGTNVGTVEADDVALVGQSASGIDADALANGNFIF
ncbi:hypothetical protein N8Z44_01215 [Planktomarina temperata]|nr:hypothetical protein [Planktomarina temperata]